MKVLFITHSGNFVYGAARSLGLLLVITPSNLSSRSARRSQRTRVRLSRYNVD